MDDSTEFEALLKAMRVLGFSEDTISSILSLVAGLLHMGQVSRVVRSAIEMTASSF